MSLTATSPTAMALTALPHRTLIRINGEEAAHFLEGLITSSLPEAGQALGSALLTPQGKLLFSFLVSRDGEGFLIECAATEREDLIKRLTLYRLRAKVTIAPDEAPVLAGGGEGLADTRHADMPARHYGQGEASGSLEAYDSQRAALGVLEGPQEIIASHDFPHDVALDLTGAVSFTKGCFVGQEVVSRVKHRGTARRRPVILSGAPLQPGAPVIAGEREIGRVRLVAGGQGVAVLRIDQIRQPAMVDGTPVTLALPPYATYSLETSQETETS